jgi:hypothetical protein
MNGSQTAGGGVTTRIDRRPSDRKHDDGPRIAHIRDWDVYEITGEIKGLCGKRLKGIPAVGYRDRCVVCVSLANDQRWGFR